MMKTMESSHRQTTCRNGRRSGWIALLTVLVTVWLGASPAAAWWHDDWGLRRKIVLDTSEGGAAIGEGLSDVPVLLRLHAGNFDFSKVRQDGGDIRFVGSDDQTALKYEIDTFDTIDEIGLIWVRVPKLDPGSNGNFISMYYGNEAAEESQDPAATFGGPQALVYHMGEAEGPPRDASPNGNHASEFAGGQALPAVIGNGMSFYGGDNRIVVPHSPSLNLADGFTWSGWVRIGQPAADGYLLSQAGDGGAIRIGIDGTGVYAAIAGKGEETVAGPAELAIDTWHHVAVTARPGQRLTVFVDGEQAAAADLPGGIPALASDIVLGNAAGGGHPLIADLDEVRVNSRPMSPDWIKAMVASEGLEARLVGLGEELSGGGGGFLPAYYLKTIAANISMDGWLIISLLMVLGVLSGIVLVSKAFFIYLNNKDNGAFQKSFYTHGGLFCLDGEYEEFENSPLHRIYRNGCSTLTRIFHIKEERGGAEARPILSRTEMNNFKASLERGYIEETKGFNSWMVIMTLAISGGPFLGLLGTVWGVMNTFAAMAEAGEANIMAIAPGVASALATTVFGLIVAIPALFGYNYLTGKIKDLTADMTIFIDEFILIVDEHHGENR